MGKLKTFEEYEYTTDSDKVWIIGIPSGEALQVSRDAIEDLYREKLIHYNVDYVDIGFFAFKDENIDYVKSMCNIKEEPKVKAKPEAYHDIRIFKNDFNSVLMDVILTTINNSSEDIEFYAQDGSLGITYGPGTGIIGTEGDYCIEVNMDSHGARYHLVRKRKGRVVDEYNLSTDSQLLQRLDYELSH